VQDTAHSRELLTIIARDSFADIVCQVALFGAQNRDGLFRKRYFCPVVAAAFPE
jgi:hypothetical protein